MWGRRGSRGNGGAGMSERNWQVQSQYQHNVLYAPAPNIGRIARDKWLWRWRRRRWLSNRPLADSALNARKHCYESEFINCLCTQSISRRRQSGRWLSFYIEIHIIKYYIIYVHVDCELRYWGIGIEPLLLHRRQRSHQFIPPSLPILPLSPSLSLTLSDQRSWRFRISFKRSILLVPEVVMKASCTLIKTPQPIRYKMNGFGFPTRCDM